MREKPTASSITTHLAPHLTNTQLGLTVRINTKAVQGVILIKIHQVTMKFQNEFHRVRTKPKGETTYLIVLHWHGRRRRREKTNIIDGVTGEKDEKNRRRQQREGRNESMALRLEEMVEEESRMEISIRL